MPRTPWYRLTPEQTDASVRKQLRYQIRKCVKLARKHDAHLTHTIGCPYCESLIEKGKPKPTRKINQLCAPNLND